MRNSPSRFVPRNRRAAGVFTLCGALALSVSHAAAEQKKSAPAPAARPAAPAAAAHTPAAGAGGAAHGPTTGGAGAAHGPTTGGASGEHGPTTGGSTANHGPTTTGSGAAHVTTSSPGGNRTSTGGAGPSAAGGAARSTGTPSGNHPASSSFANRPAPAGSHELHAANGAAVRTRADGSRSDIHDPKRGMDIHHGLSGNRRVSVERPDHSRVVAERGGRGYVQHPYNFHGREFGHRTFYDHGRAYDRFYGRYAYGGGYLDVYAPARFYPVGFYGYAYAPWAAPVPYAWGWGAAPWYGYYGAFYAPYPVYPAPAFWLADFVIAASLAAAFEAGAASAADLGPAPETTVSLLEGPGLEGPGLEGPSLLEASRWIVDRLVGSAEANPVSTPAMTPEVKQMVADEIKGLVQHEGDEAKDNSAQQDTDPAKDNVTQLLSDNQPHVLVGGTDLDLVTGSGQECAFSQGDVLKVASPPAANAAAVNATVLASKGGKECPLAATVSVTVADLQDMHNHMREQVDDGLAELQSKQGKGGLPAAPASASGAPVKAGFAVGAPPPDSTAKDQISQQAKDADQAENEATASVAAAPAAGSGSSTTITIGQSIDTVTGILGNPTRIIDLGAKKIYTYPDMKITFSNGKVANVE